LRRLLLATGGDVEELAQWAMAARDTDNDAAALTAYQARQQYGVLKVVGRIKARAAEIKRLEFEKHLSEIRARPQKSGPRGDRYIDIDQWIILHAEAIARQPPPRMSVKSIVARAVRDNWSPALGQNEWAATARIFGRLRPRRVRINGAIALLLPDVKSFLTDCIEPRKRGVRKFGRPNGFVRLN